MAIRMFFSLLVLLPLSVLHPAEIAAGSGQTTEAISFQAVTQAPSRRVYFFDPSGNEERLITLQAQLLERGAYHVNVFLPSHIVCMLPDDVPADDFIRGVTIVAGEDRGPDIPAASGSSDPFEFYRECYDLARKIAAPDDEIVRAIRELPGERGIRDTVAVTDYSRLEESLDSVSPGQEDDRTIFQDSEFMAGKIMLNLILPESKGWEETWRNDELDAAVKGALAGIIYYQEQFSYAPISYIVRTYRKAVTSYEPAHTRFENHEYWIKDIMKNLGYTFYNFTAPQTVHEFHNVMRERYGADWIFTAFIIRAQQTYNHQIVQTDFIGYSILGGPYTIIPFPPGPFGDMGGGNYTLSSHMQHETGHIFWALDEAEHAKPRDCNVRSGYLDYINGSKVEQYILSNIPVNACVGMVTPCVMEDPDWNGGWVCPFTAGQIGIIDADENSVIDVFDSDPIVEFQGGDAETIVVDTFTVRGTVKSVPIRNHNSQQDPAYWNDYASPLKDAVMDINGFGNLYLLAEDGRWDELEEEVVIPLTDLSVGLTSVELYIRNQAGCKSPARIKKIFRAGLSYSLYSAVCGNDGIALSWYLIGETFNARFDLYRIDMSEGMHDTTLIASDLKPSGEPEDQFLPFRFFDDSVESFHTYGYFVRGMFELSIQGGEPRMFITDSKVFKGTAILPIPEGDFISRATPNPFRSTTHFSILVPTTIEGGASPGDGFAGNGAAPASALPREIPTRLEVIVYDVLGRRVKMIAREKRYGAAATLEWDGTNDAGERVPSGIYFLKIMAGNKTQVRKVALLR